MGRLLSSLKGRVHKNLRSKRGETLLELVLSVGLFSVTMLTIATMFLAAAKTVKSNYDADRNFDRMMTAIVKNENTVKESGESLTFHFQGASRTASQNVSLFRTDIEGAGKIYRFRIGE